MAIKPLVLFALNKHWRIWSFQEEQVMSCWCKQWGAWDLWCMTRQCCFQHSILQSVCQTVALILQAGSAYASVYGVFVQQHSQRLKPVSRPHCKLADFVQENFSPKVWGAVLLGQLTRWRRDWAGVAYMQTAAWNLLTEKCRLRRVRSDSSSASFLKLLSRMARIEPSWGNKILKHVSKESHGPCVVHVVKLWSSKDAGSLVCMSGAKSLGIPLALLQAQPESHLTPQLWFWCKRALFLWWDIPVTGLLPDVGVMAVLLSLHYRRGNIWLSTLVLQGSDSVSISWRSYGRNGWRAVIQ